MDVMVFMFYSDELVDVETGIVTEYFFLIIITFL
jgi:hypothetical protein